jgi:hypothetical protein
MPTQEQLNAALQAGYTPQQIKLAIAKSNTNTQEQPKGVSSWLTGGKKGVGGILNAAGNILNLPSYAIGGLLNKGQDVFGSKYAQGQSQGLGILEGIKNKRGVFTELPETIGVDPNSTAGKVIGFGGELLTPNLPIGKAFKAFKGADAVSDVSKAGKFSKLGSKISGISNDAARKLLEKSYKLSASDVEKIAKSIGVTNEAEKAVKVIDYLEGLGLQGANRGSLKTLNKLANKAQGGYDSLVKTGTNITRKEYADALLKQALEMEKIGTPQSRRLGEQLFKEAEYQSKQLGKLTDTDLTRMKSQAFSDASASQISDAYSSGLNEQIGRAGVNTLENIAPGSEQAGKTLRGFRTTQEVIGKKANTGLGTQLVNAFKPSAFGAGAGALYGYSTGQDPLKSAGVGLAIGIGANNPKVLNMTGKVIQKGLPKVENKAVRTFGKVGLDLFKKTPSRALRVYSQPKTNQIETIKSPTLNKTQYQQKTYNPTITPAQPKFKSTMPTAEAFYAEIRKKRGY